MIRGAISKKLTKRGLIFLKTAVWFLFIKKLIKEISKYIIKTNQQIGKSKVRILTNLHASRVRAKTSIAKFLLMKREVYTSVILVGDF